MNKEFIKNETGKISLVTSVSNEKESGDLLLLLHGGSKTIGKDRFEYLQTKLAENNISSVSFDYPGVGASDGSMNESSLESRIKDTEYVIKFIKEKYPKKNLILFGVSMGGYIALGIVDKFPELFIKIILHAPASYAEESHSVKFNDDFTKILRTKNSWKNSLSFKWLEKYQGRALFLIGETDTVIPKEIVTEYRDILGDKKSDSKFITIPEIGHELWTKDEASDHHKDLFCNEIIKFIREL